MESQTGPSLMNQVQNWYHSLPLCTKGTFTLITIVYLFQLVTGYDNHYWLCLSASGVLNHAQVYRVFTSVIVHGGLLHVAFNMLAFVPMGASLERMIGTVQFTYLILLFTLLESLMYVGLSYGLAASGIVSGAMQLCAIGFSGVIFGLIVVDTAQSSLAQRSIFGLFTVPAPYYPWALLVLWQLLMPSVSFLGHLCGVLTGQLWVWGYLKPLALSRPATAWLEGRWPVSAFCVPRPTFIMMAGPILPYSAATAHAGDHAPGRAGLHGNGSSGNFLAPLLRWARRGGQPEGGGGDADEEAGGRAPAGSVAGGPAMGADGHGGKFPGASRVLGSVSPVATPPPSTAAALAAEARASGKGKGAGTSGPGGGGAGSS